MKRHPQILDREHTALLIVDVQEKMNAVMMHGDLVVDSILKLFITENHLYQKYINTQGI